RGPPGEAAHMWAAVPMLIVASPSDVEPSVGFLHQGAEQRQPACLRSTPSRPLVVPSERSNSRFFPYNADCARRSARPSSSSSTGRSTAVSYVAAIEDPANFKTSRSVGAWLGLTTRRYQSGEV